MNGALFALTNAPLPHLVVRGVTLSPQAPDRDTLKKLGETLVTSLFTEAVNQGNFHDAGQTI